MADKFKLVAPYRSAPPVDVHSDLYDKLIKARNVVVRLLEFEEAFELFSQSYLRLETILFEITLNYRVRKHKPKSAIELFADFREKLNLELLTFLSASAVVIEKGDRLAKNAIVDGFDEATFEPFRTGIFDNNFEYRVMCGLRNFALHNKLPLGGLILSSKMETGGETIRPNDLARLRITCNPTFTTKALIEDDTMRTATRDEIRDTGAEGLDIKWFVRRFVELVAERQFKIRELTHSGCDNALSEIHSAGSLLDLNDDKPLSVFSVQVVSKGSSETEAVVFSLSHLERVNDKRETWEMLHHVAGLYISTEIIKKGGVFTSDPPKYYFPR